MSPASTIQLQKKFLNFKLRNKALGVLSNGESLFFLPEIGVSLGGEPPAVVGAAATLKEAIDCLNLGAISTVKIFEKH